MNPSPSESDPQADPASSGVAVLDRAFALLNAYGAGDEQLSLTELSRRTGLYKSTALRLLAALEHGGFIRKTPEGHYAIGPQPMRLAAIYQKSLRIDSVIAPLLAELSDKLGETASFYVRSGERRVVLSRVEPARAVRFSIRAGEEFDIRQGASGKLLLAFTSGDGAEAKAIQARLWAYSLGERDGETASASAAVLGADGSIQGALTVSGPIARLGPAEAMLPALDALLDAAARASHALGGITHAFMASRKALQASDIQAPVAGA